MPEALKKNTLLLVDDEPRVLKSLQRALAKEGYRIHAFTRPHDALQLLKSEPVGVIISDLCMPQMDGSEFLRRAAEEQPHAVQITLSGYVEEDRMLQRVGDTSWCSLSKPWCNQELRLRVAEAFQKLG